MRLSSPLARHIGLATILAAASGAAETSPKRKQAEVLAIMERVADWQLAHPYIQAPPTDWTNAAFYTGLIELADISSSTRFYSALVKMADGNQWKLGPLPFHADDHCVGQTYAELYLRDRQPRMIAPMREALDYVLAHPHDDNLNFDKEKNPTRLERWSWCDALYMAPPAYVRLWAATHDPRYLDFAITKWWVTSDYLYDKEAHLFFRDSTFFDKREANGKKVFWSRGNGWVMGGLVRMLQFLPAEHPDRARFEQQFRELAVSIRNVQQGDGFWRVSLLDPASYPAKESSGTGFYCYALAWGVNNGLLDRATFAPNALLAWESISSCVQADGKLTHVQVVAGSPKDFPEDGTMPYGVGAFLLAGSEIYLLVK